MTDEQQLTIYKELGALTESVRSMHRRFDEFIAREQLSEADAEKAHDDLDVRVRALERWRAKVVGLAIGISVSAGAVGGLVAEGIQRLSGG